MKNKYLLVYAFECEVAQIDYEPKCQYSRIHWESFEFAGIVLFGCCGDLTGHLPTGRLIIPSKWFHEDELNAIEIEDGNPYQAGVSANAIVHDEHYRASIASSYLEAQIVDLESYDLAKKCQEYDILFVSVRYVIDRCHKKVKPTGINHFWRIWQHYKMQKKMEQWLNEKYL